MKKHVFGKKFNRDTNERRALFKNLISALVLKERIQTTEAKAKAIRSSAEKAITKAKKNGKVAKRFLGDVLVPAAVDKLIDDIAPRFKDRNGGYTRIIRVGRRFGDNAMEVVMEWTESALLGKKTERSSRTPRLTRQTKSERRPQSSRRRPIVSRSGKRASKKATK